MPVGGADGNGYISTVFTGAVGVSAIAGTSTSVWESPPFVYEGGTTNARLLNISRRASVDQLLAVEGNSAEYSVQLADVSAGGAGPTVIGPDTLAGADTWRAVPRRRSSRPSSRRATPTRSGSRRATRPGPASWSPVRPTTTTSPCARPAPTGAGNGKGNGSGNGAGPTAR